MQSTADDFVTREVETKIPEIETKKPGLMRSIMQKAGEVGTEYLDLTFLQFSEDELARHRQARADEKTRYHDLRSGESLYDLARLYYHQPSAWRRIAEANGIKGVSASSDAELHKWAARHHKRRLRIPPAPRSGGR